MADAANSLMDILPASAKFSCEDKKQAGKSMNDEPDIMTIQEVAKYLRLNEKTTYRYAALGTIPGFKIGGAWRFRRSQIVQWIEHIEGKENGSQHTQ